MYKLQLYSYTLGLCAGIHIKVFIKTCAKNTYDNWWPHSCTSSLLWAYCCRVLCSNSLLKVLYPPCWLFFREYLSLSNCWSSGLSWSIKDKFLANAVLYWRARVLEGVVSVDSCIDGVTSLSRRVVPVLWSVDTVEGLAGATSVGTYHVSFRATIFFSVIQILRDGNAFKSSILLIEP